MPTAIFTFLVFGFETRKNNEAPYVSLPVTRSMVVISRYISSILFLVLGTVFFLILAGLFDTVLPALKPRFEQLLRIDVALTYVLVLSFFISIAFPLIFRFGMLWGVVLLFLVITPFFAVAPVFINDSAFNAIDFFHRVTASSDQPAFYPIVFLISVAILSVSSLFSIKFYRLIDLQCTLKGDSAVVILSVIDEGTLVRRGKSRERKS